MREIEDALNTLIDTIKSTKEYNQYQTVRKAKECMLRF